MVSSELGIRKWAPPEREGTTFKILQEFLREISNAIVIVWWSDGLNEV